MSTQSTVGAPTQSLDGQAAAENAYQDSGSSPPAHDDSSNQPLTNSVRISAGQQTTGQIGGLQLARRRYQKGHLRLRGKREKVWIGRWLEDELQTDGTVVRRHKSDVLGTLKQFPTKRLAQQELDAR